MFNKLGTHTQSYTVHTSRRKDVCRWFLAKKNKNKTHFSKPYDQMKRVAVNVSYIYTNERRQYFYMCMCAYVFMMI